MLYFGTPGPVFLGRISPVRRFVVSVVQCGEVTMVGGDDRTYRTIMKDERGGIFWFDVPLTYLNFVTGGFEEMIIFNIWHKTTALKLFKSPR